MTYSYSGIAKVSKIPFKSKNKDKRQAAYLKLKKTNESAKRDQRLRRRREEDRHSQLRVERRARNVPITIDRKRVWDDVEDVEGDGIGLSVDVERFKKPRVDTGEADDGVGLTESKLQQIQQDPAASGLSSEDEKDEQNQSGSDSQADDLASLMSDSNDEQQDTEERTGPEELNESRSQKKPQDRAASPPASTTSTNMSMVPDALAAKFPTLFKPPDTPKILITTSLGGTIHDEAELLTDLFPNSEYIRRQRHRYNSHHFSLREIASGASKRGYTTLLVLNEDQKRPCGLSVIHLPKGPTFHFSVNNWVEGRKLLGHGRPTDHYPELILNNFRTPLGLLTAHLFRTMFPPQPEIQGRQVVTLHNQRDYMFVRRHRYIFRDKRQTEKPVTDANGKAVKGVEDIKAGLQELGPRFTLKLRRVDKGIQRASGQEWEWDAAMEKQRTRFNL